MSEEKLPPTLFQSTSEIVEQIIDEKDPSKLEDLTAMFMMNQKKKDIVRLNRLSNLIEVMDDETINRFSDAPEQISNKDLTSFINLTQNAMHNIKEDIAAQPKVQITQIGEVNIDSDPLSRESRERILKAVNEIINKKNDIIDVEEEECDET